MSTQGPRWAHLDTGIATINLMLDVKLDAIIDLQSVPSNAAVFAILANLIASHLEKPDTRVVVIECLKPFHWQWLQCHASYQESWRLEKRLVLYRLDSFAKLFSFFSQLPMENSQSGATLVLILNFHELMEYYRLQLAASHEELLLKHQIEKNNVLIANKDKATEEGYDLIELPQLPRNSGLLKISPYHRFKEHFDSLMLLINDFTYRYSGVVVMQGYMLPKYRQYNKTKLVAESSQRETQTASETSNMAPPEKQYSHSRLVFTPVTFTRELESDNKAASRILLYNDWYFNSPHFLSEKRPKEESDYHFVFVAKITNFQGLQTINEAVFFDFQRNPFHKSIEALQDPWFINLLATQNDEGDEQVEEENLSTLLQTTTQNLSRKRKHRSLSMPSSPPITASQLNLHIDYHGDIDDAEGHDSDHSDAKSVEINIEAYSFDGRLVIEESDVELIGTIYGNLEDMDSQDSGFGWLSRHT